MGTGTSLGLILALDRFGVDFEAVKFSNAVLFGLTFFPPIFFSWPFAVDSPGLTTAPGGPCLILLERAAASSNVLLSWKLLRSTRRSFDSFRNLIDATIVL